MQMKDKLIYNDLTKPRRNWIGYVLLSLALLIFLATLFTVALLERNSTTATNTFAVDRLMVRLKSAFSASIDDSVETPAFVARIEREAVNATRRSGKNGYYEEQRAVVVNSETMENEQRESNAPAAAADSYDQEQYYDGGDDDDDDSYDYASSPYYQAAYPHRQRAGGGGGNSKYSADGGDEGRTLNEQQKQQNAETYERWRNTASRAPMIATPKVAQGKQFALPVNFIKSKPQYAAYNYGSDDEGSQRDNYYNHRVAQHPAYRQRLGQVTDTQATNNAVAVPEYQENTLVSILKGIKQVWDIYQALSNAWNTIYENRQKHLEQLEKEAKKKEAQKTRINSKKPPRIEDVKGGNAQRNQTKKAKTTTTTTSAPKIETTTKSTTTVAATQASTALAQAKVEPRTFNEDDEFDDDDVEVEKDSQERSRERREADMTTTAAEDVGEGRYIKGDPLKGYYDFIITEGSYKFWAVFQVGTALLIIYSTFAAIYYSKVNPLVSDYDYTDYLGGGRSMTGGDLDFVDDVESTTNKTVTAASFNRSRSDWVPKTAHSLKFILEAIDKLPVDHEFDDIVTKQKNKQ